jgi:hypothetical protein
MGLNIFIMVSACGRAVELYSHDILTAQYAGTFFGRLCGFLARRVRNQSKLSASGFWMAGSCKRLADDHLFARLKAV